ncbi:MAG: ERF family protein, partial [Woeseia sp.]
MARQDPVSHDDAIQLHGYGVGFDSGDKGYGKAVSYAKKYMLLTAFNMVTGDDVDQ